MAQDSVAVKRLREAIPSYLTARASRDLVVAAHQELTVEWWLNHRQRFDVFVSDFVLRESARGEHLRRSWSDSREGGRGCAARAGSWSTKCRPVARRSN